MPHSLHSSFGTTLRQHRLDSGLSLRKFAARIAYSPGHLSHIENGVKFPTVKFAQACERELGLPGQLVPLVTAESDAPLAQLPSSGGMFIGRLGGLRRVSSCLREGGQVILLDGPPGIGKTALAVKSASDPELTRHYGDGILFADLHGFTPGQSPTTPADVAENFLRTLGIAQEQIPSGDDGRFALLRSVLSNRQILIVLDNAASVSQVRPLLPAANGCGVIVTSRRQLAGLAIRDGAIRVSLGPLREQDAVELLVRIIGERAQAQPEHTAELARLCSCWPLALRIIGERLVSQEHLSLEDLCRELREARLDALSINEEDDEAAAVRAVFDLSYQALPADDAAAFRALGLHPGSHISVSAVAALIGTPEATARVRMRRLCQAHLVTEFKIDLYQLHDLLKAYAAERAEIEDSGQDRRLATRRLLDYYLGSVATTTAMLAPYRQHPVVDMAALSSPTMVPDSYEEALAWCDAEVTNFSPIVSLAVAQNYPQVWRFAASLWDYFHVRRPWGCWWATTTTAQRQLDEEPDPFGRAWLLTSLGDYNRRRGEGAAARGYFEQALAIRQEIEDRPGEGWLWFCLGLTARTEGKPDDAVRELHEALKIFTELDDVYAQGRCLQLTGHALWDAGERDEAIAHLHDALDCFSKVEDAHDQALVFSALGRIHSDAQQAIEYLEAALPTLREIGDWQGEVDALMAFGDAQWRLGDEPKARERWSEASKILHDRNEFKQNATLDARIRSITKAETEARPELPRQEAPHDC